MFGVLAPEEMIYGLRFTLLAAGAFASAIFHEVAASFVNWQPITSKLGYAALVCFGKG
jgi:hypothetical protein